MRRLIAIALAAAVLGACSSGGCDAGDNKPAASPAEAPSAGGGGSRAGTSETVSFQGLGKDAPPPPAPGQAPAAPGTSTATAALGGTAPNDPPQVVACDGFPNLLPDCKTDPAYAALKSKCCPTGTVDRCIAVPGGARLIGRSCSAPAR